MTEMTGYTYGPAEIAAIICILTVMLSVRRITDVIPSMLGCLFRWKEAFNLEYSVRLSRNRNITFIVLTVPACLLAARFRLYDPDFMSGMTPPLRLLVTCGVFIGYLLTRRLSGTVFRPKTMDRNAYNAARMLFLTFFSLMSMVCIITAGALSFTDTDDTVIRQVSLYITGGFYLLFIFRKCQIFSHYCSLFSTILYLCTLEILPTGLLVASAMFL